MKRYYRFIAIGLFFTALLSSCAAGPRRTSCSQRAWWCRIVEADKQEVKKVAIEQQTTLMATEEVETVY